MKDIVDKALKEYQQAELEFEQCKEDGLIDYHIYNIKAKQSKYEYWLRKVKDVEMVGRVGS